jgi:hypothetical protein
MGGRKETHADALQMTERERLKVETLKMGEARQ